MLIILRLKRSGRPQQPDITSINLPIQTVTSTRNAKFRKPCNRNNATNTVSTSVRRDRTTTWSRIKVAHWSVRSPSLSDMQENTFSFTQTTRQCTPLSEQGIQRLHEDERYFLPPSNSTLATSKRLGGIIHETFNQSSWRCAAGRAWLAARPLPIPPHLPLYSSLNNAGVSHQQSCCTTDLFAMEHLPSKLQTTSPRNSTEK